jgi:hypothetical protein
MVVRLTQAVVCLVQTLVCLVQTLVCLVIATQVMRIWFFLSRLLGQAKSRSHA